MNYKDIYKEWLENEYFIDVRNELENISSNEIDIEDRFYKELEFGTAGIRGVMEAGTNRINNYVIMRCTEGIAKYLKNLGQAAMDKGVVIAYDTRHNSDVYAEITALVLNQNGIKAYLWNDVTPTPVLSYAVRYLKTSLGIVITSSHNPKEYNGYKVYSSDGGQIVSPIDKQIIDLIKETKYSDCTKMEKNMAINKGLYNILDESIKNSFINTMSGYIINKDLVKNNAKDLKIVYTPLHGTGAEVMVEL